MPQLSSNEEAQLAQTIEMFEVITQSQPLDYQSLEILKEAYSKLGRQPEVINTSKRIAKAYVHLGQLSSAILEYESILQQYPDDPDVQHALDEIENRATNFAPRSAPPEAVQPQPAARENPAAISATAQPSVVIDDGRQGMFQLLVEGKHLTELDFDRIWRTPDPRDAPHQPVAPFLLGLSEQGLLPCEDSLKLLCGRTRLGYVPIEKYEVDLEVARAFPRDVCYRWCVLPFDRMSKSVLVATANPFNQQAAKELGQSTSNRLFWYLASPLELVRTLQRTYR